MNDYSRSEYLKALLNQKKTLQANSNSLVSPATPQSSSIEDLALMDTSFSGASSTPTPEEPQDQTDRNWWQRTLDTTSEFVSNISEGALGVVGGIVDAGGYLYGAISGDHQGAQDFMNYDWEAQALNVLNQLDGNNIFSGDVFTNDYWNDWATVGSSEASRAQLNELHRNSWTSEMGAEGQQVYNQITQGIGSALPSIALAMATGGASAVTMGALGVSAFGSSANEALNDGASYGQAAIYGGISAGVEILVESLGGVNGVKPGKEALKAASQKGFKEIIKGTLKDMAGEGMEEVISDLSSPLIKALSYKGTEALKEYTEPDFIPNLIVSFVGGAAGALVGSTIQQGSLTRKYTKEGVSCINEFNTANQLQQEFNTNVSHGGNVTELSKEYGAAYSEHVKLGLEKLNKLQKENPEAFKKVVRAMSQDVNKKSTEATYQQAVNTLKADTGKSMLQRYLKNISGRLGYAIDVIDEDALQSAEEFTKATGIQLTQEQIEQFNDPTTIKKGLNINGKTYISNKYKNSINQMIMHEAVSHGYLDSNPELRNSFIENLRTNPELKTKLNEITKEVYETYGLNKTQITNMLNNTSSKETLNSETTAKFIELLYSDNNISSVLNTLNKSNLRSMLSRAISYLKTKGDSTAQARLQLEKVLSKIKLKQDSANRKGIKFSIEKVGNRKCVVIDLDSSIQVELNNLTPKQRQTRIEKYIKEQFSKIDYNGDTLHITGKTARKITNTYKEEKIRAVAQVKELVESSEFIETKNIEHKLFSEMSYLKTLFRIGNNYYEGQLNIGFHKASKQLQIYELNKIKEVVVTASLKPEVESTSNSSINQNNQNSNNQTKFSKVKSTTTSTTTQTAPKAKSSVYSDFFNVDGTIKAEWVKKGAQANLGNVVGLNDSKFIIQVALDTISRNFGISNEIKLDDISALSRKFFEQYNVSDGKVSRVKAYEVLLNGLLEANVTITQTNQKIKLKDLLFQNVAITNYTSINDFKADMANLIEDMIKAYGTPTKMQQAYDKFNKKIDKLEKELEEQVKTVKLVYNTARLSDKIKAFYDDHIVKARLGTLFPELPYLRNLAKGITPSSVTGSITSNSIDNIIKHLEAIKYEPNSETLEALGLKFNQEWYDMLQHFKSKRVLVNVVNKQTNTSKQELRFPNRKLTYEENVMLNKFMKDLKDTIESRIRQEEIKIRKRLSKATTEINIARKTHKKGAGFIKRELNMVTSPGVILSEMVGYNTETVKICHDDLLEAYIMQQYQEQVFKDDYIRLAKQEKVKHTLEKKTKITLNGREYNLSNELLLEFYVASLAPENKKVMLEQSCDFEYKNQECTVKFTEETLKLIESKLSPELKSFGKKVLEMYNTNLKQYAKEHGVEVLENEVYYPRSRSDVTVTEVENIAQRFRSLNPDTLPINQQRNNKSKKGLQFIGLTARFNSYANQVSKIGEMSEALEVYSKFLNTKVVDENGNKVSRNELLNRIDKEWTTLKAYLEYQLLGISSEKIKIKNDSKFKKYYQNLVASTLGANISTILKQSASIPTILAEVHSTSWLKSVMDIKSGVVNLVTYEKLKQKIIDSSPLLYKRFSKGELIKAYGLDTPLNWLSKALMKPMEKMDEAVIVMFGYQTALYEAKLELKGTNPTSDQIHERAIKILERIALNTQSNNVAPKMSMARSGQGGFLRKTFSYFTSDLNNMINIIRETMASKSIAKQNIAEISKTIEETKEKLTNITNSYNEKIANEQDPKKKAQLQTKLKNKTDEINLELQNLEAILKTNQAILDEGDQWKDVVKLLFIMAAKGLLLAGVGQLVDRLYGRKAWNEDTTDEFIISLIHESTVYNIPYVQTIANSIQYDTPIGAFDLTILNDTIDIARILNEELQKENPNLSGIGFKFAAVVGQLTGIPVKNVYNLVFGVWKNIDSEGYKVDSIIKGYSDTYILQQYKESASVGRTNQADGDLQFLMKGYKVSTTSDTVRKELVQLTKDGYNALPKNYMLGYTDENGNKIMLNENELDLFRTAYDKSNKDVEALLNVTEYKNMTQEQKADLIKKIYDAYYSYAKAKVLKQEKADNKLATMLLYTDGKFNASKYVNVLDTINNIKESKTKTRKELVTEYINKLRGYSKQEKLLIMRMAGYKISEGNERMLTVYLRKAGLSNKEIKQFLGNEENDEKSKNLLERKG